VLSAYRSVNSRAIVDTVAETLNKMVEIIDGTFRRAADPPPHTAMCAAETSKIALHHNIGFDRGSNFLFVNHGFDG
jgi:hypothetical protein